MCRAGVLLLQELLVWISGCLSRCIRRVAIWLKPCISIDSCLHVSLFVTWDTCLNCQLQLCCCVLHASCNRHWKVSVSNQYALPLLTIRYQNLVCLPIGNWLFSLQANSSCDISKPNWAAWKCLTNLFLLINRRSEVTATQYSHKNFIKRSSIRTRIPIQEDSRAANKVLSWNWIKRDAVLLLASYPSRSSWIGLSKLGACIAMHF